MQEALVQSGVPKRYLENDDGTVFLDKDGNIVPSESGAAIVMDVHTGEILAIASTPGSIRTISIRTERPGLGKSAIQPAPSFDQQGYCRNLPAGLDLQDDCCACRPGGRRDGAGNTSLLQWHMDRAMPAFTAGSAGAMAR